jgi:hypothetical protein
MRLGFPNGPRKSPQGVGGIPGFPQPVSYSLASIHLRLLLHCSVFSRRLYEDQRLHPTAPSEITKRGRWAEQKGFSLVNDAKVRRWAGAFGVAGFVVFLAALPLYYLAGPEPRIEDTAATSAFVTRASTFILTRATLADPLIMIGFLVFLAGFRHTLRLARPDHEWVSTLVFGAGLVVITLELVGDALQAAAALDTVVNAEPAVVRGLLEASFPFFGAVGLLMSALFLSSAGYATLATGALPKWTGWVAYGAAVANLAAAPSILVGPDYRAFYTATGYVTMIGQGLLVIWFAVASVSMIVVKPATRVSTPGNGV